MSERRRIEFGAAVILGLFAGVMGVLWLRDSTEIRFVLPSNFHGGFVIVEDPAGADLGWRFAHKFVVYVPPSRVVKVKSFFPFHRYHGESVQIGRDGPILPANTSQSSEAIELRGRESGDRAVNGVRYRFRIWYVMGTAAEAAAFDPWSLFQES